MLTEADSHLGITNRLLAPRARRVCLAFPIDGPRRRRATSSPAARCPPPATDRAAARARFGLRRTASTCVLVFGGSLGARTINEAAVEAFARGAVSRPARGRARATTTRSRRASTATHYDLRPYIDDFGEALAACDLCVARAGGSIFEIAAAGKPAMLVPYPHASADHQTANARWMARRGRGGRRARRRADAGAAGPARSARCSATRRAWRRWRRASAALARPDAAQAVADEVLRGRARARAR